MLHKFRRIYGTTFPVGFILQLCILLFKSGHQHKEERLLGEVGCRVHALGFHSRFRLTWAVSVQHVALRLQSKPYLDQYIWEQILRKTDWITCLRLNHISFAEQLMPSNEKAQAQLNSSVASGDIQLVSRILKNFDVFPNMDIAAKADQMEMLKVLDGMDKAGSCICRATKDMAVHAATNCNLAMLDWLICNRLEVDGSGVLAAAAEVGSIFMINWVVEQAEYLQALQSVDVFNQGPSEALYKALQAGHVDIAIFLVDHFRLHATACLHAINHASTRSAVQQFLLLYSGDESCTEWCVWTVEAVKRGNVEILSAVLDAMQRVRGTRIPVYTASQPLMDTAAKYGTVSMLQFLFAQMPDHLKRVSDEAMVAAAAKGDLDMVRILQAHYIIMTQNVWNFSCLACITLELQLEPQQVFYLFWCTNALHFVSPWPAETHKVHKACQAYTYSARQ